LQYPPLGSGTGLNAGRQKILEINKKTSFQNQLLYLNFAFPLGNNRNSLHHELAKLFKMLSNTFTIFPFFPNFVKHLLVVYMSSWKKKWR